MKQADAQLAYVRKAVANNFLSGRRRRASGELLLDDLPDSLRDDPGFAAVENRDAVWSLLQGLPDRQRAVLVLRYFHDLSDDDIAAALKCRPGSVRSLLSRGLAAIRGAEPGSVEGLLPPYSSRDNLTALTPPGEVN